MKKILFSAVLAFFAMTAQAQLVGVDANANSGAESTSGATAQNGGNTLIMPSGHKTTTVKTAPGHVLGGFSGSFSSDYCFGTAQAGGSWLGGSLGGGGPQEGYSCVGLRVYERLQQGAASEERPEVRAVLKDTSYDVLCTVHDTVKKTMQARGFCVDKQVQAQDGRVLTPAEATAARNGNYTGSDPVVLRRLSN